MIDPRFVAVAVRGPIGLQGNVDPLALVTGRGALEAEAGQLLATMRGRLLLFSLGHDNDKVTPAEHVR